MRLGIDFGTCFTSAAFLNGGTLITVKDPLTGSFSLPSTIFYTRNGKMLVGNQANYQRLRYPDRFRGELKRVLGQDTPILLGDTAFQVVDLIAAIVVKLKNDANGITQGMGKPPFTEAIMTVPAVYQGYLQEQVRKFASKAGFSTENVKLLTEPVAGAYYYASKNVIQSGEIVLVYDLGGGTFDTALLKKTGETFEYLASPDGFSDHGGLDFDRAIYLDLVSQHDELQELLNGSRTDAIALQARRTVGDMCILLKHQLSDIEEAWLSYVVPGTGAMSEYTLQRTDFQAMIAPIVRDTVTCCRRVIEQAGITPEQISHILLVGGSCRIPFIHQTLQRAFNRPIITAPDLELVVCQGAAIYSKSLDMPVTTQSRTTLRRTRPFPRPDYSTVGRSKTLEHVKIAVLGLSSSGRASMMLAMYGMMREGVGDFTLNATDPYVDIELTKDWDRLVDDPNNESCWPPPTCMTDVYAFDFCHKKQGLISFDWLRSRGGILMELNSSSVEVQMWRTYLQNSAGVLLCISGELLATSIRGREMSVRSKSGVDRMNLSIVSCIPAESRPAIVISITKFDLLTERDPEEIIDEIKRLFNPLFASRSGWSVMICPVSLGRDLHYGQSGGEINPVNAHLPLAFFAYHALSNEINRLQDGFYYAPAKIDEIKKQQRLIAGQLLVGGRIYHDGKLERQLAGKVWQFEHRRPPIKPDWFGAGGNQARGSNKGGGREVPVEKQAGTERNWFGTPASPPDAQPPKT